MSPSHGSGLSRVDDVIDHNGLIRALRARSVTLVDVLSPESFAARHIQDAISLPLAEIPSRAPQVLADRHAAIVVYCGSPT